VKKSKFIPAA